ncbi:hypothetical protein GMJAKD_10115 [Candidatus Electrothrix aarhusensis]
MIKELMNNLLTVEQDEAGMEVHLKEHVEDAQLLLAYAAEKGLEMDPSLIEEIIRSRYHLQNNSFDQEKEARFWEAFNALSQKVLPVCIESLKATRVQSKAAWRFRPLGFLFRTDRSEAARTVLVYQRWTLFALTLLLIVQIYWLVGSVIITQVNENQSFQKEISQLDELLKKAEDLQSSELGRLAGQIRDNYNNKVTDISNNKIVYSKALRDWRSNIFTRWMFNQDADRDTQGNDRGFAKTGYIEARQSGQLILQPIQQYILPLLYGWIGALAYVLRSINKEIKAITYTRQSKEHYGLRTQLGALSGLAVGWFFSGSPENYATQPSFSFGNLSPLALSFLAGYSVELLFSAMDKIVSSFSSTD